MSAATPLGNRFATTRWSQVVVAGGGGAEARAAMAWLCERYWQPLRAHVRRRGFDEASADDLTQDFLLGVLQGRVVERADRERGRFRTFLLACLDHHLGHERERRRAAKRGGGRTDAELPEDGPEAPADPAYGFERDWAEALLQRARDRLAQECAADGQAARHAALAPFLSANGDGAAYAAAGVKLGLTEGAVKVAVHRLRDRFREALRAEVAETLAEPTPAAIDAELSDLLAALVERR